MACNTIKVKDFFNTRALDEIECGKEVRAMKQLLSFAMPVIYNLPGFEEREEIDVSGDAYQTKEGIFYIKGFYAQKPTGCCCNDCSCDQCETCFDLEENCSWKDNGYGRLRMHQSFGKGKLQTGRYYIPCYGGNDIVYKLPECICKAWVHYVRTIPNFDDVEAELDIPEYLLGPLALLVKYFTRTDGTEVRRLNDFNEAIARLQYIYASDPPDSMKYVGKDVPRS